MSGFNRYFDVTIRDADEEIVFTRDEVPEARLDDCLNAIALFFDKPGFTVQTEELT
jgi:hypothetical protein